MTVNSIPGAAPVARSVTAAPAAAARSEPEQRSVHVAAPKAAQVAKTSVTLSPAAQSAQEAAETPAQTAQEARGNDRQAQRLLVKQQAVTKAYTSG